MLAILLATSALAAEPVVTLGFSWGYLAQVHLTVLRPSVDLHAAWDVGPVEVGGVLRRHLSGQVTTLPGFDAGATVRVRRDLGPWSPALGLEAGLTSALDLSPEFREGWPGWDEVVADRLKTSPVYVAVDADPARLRVPLGDSGRAVAIDVLGIGFGTTLPAVGRVVLVRIDLLRVGVAL